MQTKESVIICPQNMLNVRFISIDNPIIAPTKIPTTMNVVIYSAPFGVIYLHHTSSPLLDSFNNLNIIIMGGCVSSPKDLALNEGEAPVEVPTAPENVNHGETQGAQEKTEEVAEQKREVAEEAVEAKQEVAEAATETPEAKKEDVEVEEPKAEKKSEEPLVTL